MLGDCPSHCSTFVRKLAAGTRRAATTRLRAIAASKQGTRITGAEPVLGAAVMLQSNLRVEMDLCALWAVF